MREGKLARPKVGSFTIPLRGHKRRLIALSFVLLFVLGFLPLPRIASALGWGWFSGFGYRKSHSITGSTVGAQTNYQVKIVVHYGSGTDSGGDVYCSSLCRTDFGDIRFTGSDGRSQLDYWMETETDGNSATFWVEIPSIPANPSTTTIYVYYGRSGATTTSNGVATFAFFDDATTDKSSSYTCVDIFNSGMTATLTYNSGSQRYEISHTTGPGDEEFIKINGLSLAQLEIWGEFNLLVQGGGINDQFGFLIRDQAAGRYYCRCCDYFTPKDRLIITGNSGANPSQKESTLSYVNFSGNVILTNTWYQVKMNAYSSNLWAWSDLENTYTSVTNSTFPGAGNCGIIMGFDTASKVAFKQIVVRNYCSPEPTHGGWGAPESSPSTPFAFVDGGSVAIGTSATTIATIYTSFASGDNFVLAIVNFQSTAATSIAASNLYLERVGGSGPLMSNSYSVALTSSFPGNQKWYALMGIDTSPPSSPTYFVNATAAATGISGEAKILVLNGVTGYQNQTGTEVYMTTSENTLVTQHTSLPAGDNIVFAIFEARCTRTAKTTNYTITALRLKRGSTTLSQSPYSTMMVGETSAYNLQVHLIPFVDFGAPANPTYVTTGTSDTNSYVAGKAKIVVFSRGSWYALYASGVSTLIDNSFETITTLSTNIPSGSDAIVIASEQFNNTVTSTNSITNGENELQQNNNGSTQTTNEFTLQFQKFNGGSGTSYADNGKSFALLNEFYPTPSNPPYEVIARGCSVPSYLYGEAKILVLAYNSISPRVPEFPLGAALILAVCFPILFAVRNFRRTRRA